jgi:flagellar assembly protein FliH
LSTVIKREESGPLLRRVTTVDLADHLREARAVVQAAHQQAESILRHAQEEANRLRADALRRGHAEGHAKGVEEGRRAGFEAAHEEAEQRFQREHAVVVEDLRRAIGDIERIKQDVAIRAEHDVLRFAVELATRMTFEIGVLHHEAAVENLRRALRSVSAASDLTILLHPDDVEHVRRYASELLEPAGAPEHVRWKADETIAPGGCIVRAGDCEVDATLSTQVAELVSVILGTEALGG